MPPNIVVFFSDDHAGWALPSYGNSEISAPNLTHLAEIGVLMRNAFTPCPVCSPARASFWTGLFPSQHGIHDHLAEHDGAVQETNWLAGIPTLADHLRDAGYTTALSGKWHCGTGETPKSGFDYWYSGWRKTPKYFSLSNKYSDQGRVVERRGYDTQIFTDAAIDFLRARDRERPFFLFIGYAATHNPWINRPERLVSHYRKASFHDIPDDIPHPFSHPGTHPVAPDNPQEALAQYYASVTMIDEGVGRVLEELDAQSARGDTLVVYTSDHGLNMGHHRIWGKGNGSEPLNMLEESIRVPLILNQPGAIDGGQSRTEFVNHCDLHATLLDFAQAEPKERSGSPGRSYKPGLKGEQLDWTNRYFGEYGTVRAIRDERYKLILRYGGGENLLIDLHDDPRETVNLYADEAHRQRREELRTQLKAFFAQYESPKHSGLLGDDLPIHNRREAWRIN